MSAATKRDACGSGIPAVADLGVEDVEFSNVDGVPVAIVDDVETFAYDCTPARVFDIGTVYSEGVPVTRQQFLHLVADCAKRQGKA